MRYLSLCGCVVLLACSKSSPAEPPAAPSPAPAAAPQTQPAAAPAAAADDDAMAQAGGLRWHGAAPLQRVQPKTSMRVAQYALEGDALAELAVFYFGPDQGGAVEPNITRWLGQFTQPDGSASADKAKRAQSTIAGVEITKVEVTGTYAGGMGMPGAAPAAPQADSMLLGAIASGPRGPVFFKLTGPRATVEHARGAFDAMLQSLQRE